MKTRTLHPILLLSLATLAIAGWIGIRTPGTHFTDSSRLYIDGTSSMHDWTCEVTEIDGSAEVRRAPNGDVTVAAAAATVSVSSIECKNGKMNGKLRKALNAESHPVIAFRLTNATSSVPSSEGRVALTINGKLNVAGVERDIDMPVIVSFSKDGGARFVGSLPLLMSDFGVKPPSAMLGILTTGDAITVRLDVETRAESPIQTASDDAGLAR